MAAYIYSIHCTMIKLLQVCNYCLFWTCFLNYTRISWRLITTPGKRITHRWPWCFIKTQFCSFFLSTTVYFAIPCLCCAAGCYVPRGNVLHRITFVIIYYLCRSADRHKECLNKKSLTEECTSWSPKTPDCAYLQHHKQRGEAVYTEISGKKNVKLVLKVFSFYHTLC